MAEQSLTKLIDSLITVFDQKIDIRNNNTIINDNASIEPTVPPKLNDKTEQDLAIFIMQRHQVQIELLKNPVPEIIEIIDYKEDGNEIKEQPKNYLDLIIENYITKNCSRSPVQKGSNCSVYAICNHMIDLLFIAKPEFAKHIMKNPHHAKLFCFMITNCCYGMVMPSKDKKGYKYITSMLGTPNAINVEVLIKAIYCLCGIKIDVIKLIEKDDLKKYAKEIEEWSKKFGPLILDTIPYSFIDIFRIHKIEFFNFNG